MTYYCLKCQQFCNNIMYGKTNNTLYKMYVFGNHFKVYGEFLHVNKGNM